MVDTAELLAAYDAQMRVPAGAVTTDMSYEYDGPLLRIVGGHMGRLRAPRDLGVTGAALDALIARQRDYFRDRGQGVEWKFQAHDLPADLPERLTSAGFVPELSTTVLIGLAEEVAAEPDLPDGVVLRQVTAADDLRRIAELMNEAFAEDLSWVADHLAAQITADPGRITVLVAEAGGQVVCTAHSIDSPGTDFVALLGGTTRSEWRGRGLYRALVAARAQQAIARGYRFLHVDASANSAPILRRLGFREITTSTHYRWSPPEQER